MKHLSKIVIIITVCLILGALFYPYTAVGYETLYNRLHKENPSVTREDADIFAREFQYQTYTLPRTILFSAGAALVIIAFILTAYRIRNPLKTAFSSTLTEGTYPLELRKNISTVINFVKIHPYRTGIPIILLSATLWIAFPIYVQWIATPALWGTKMFQLLLYTIPTLSIIMTIAGAITIVLSHYSKKQR